MAQQEAMEIEDQEAPDRIDEIIADATAAGKRVREASSGGGKALNLPRLIGSELIPMIVALAEELGNRDGDHENRLDILEAAIGAAGIGTGHPLAAIPAPAAVELLQRCRGLCEAFIQLETAPTQAMKEQARGIAMTIDMAFHQAGELEAEEAEAEAEAEAEEAAVQGAPDA
jgi:hypothetical protein